MVVLITAGEGGKLNFLLEEFIVIKKLRGVPSDGVGFGVNLVCEFMNLLCAIKLCLHRAQWGIKIGLDNFNVWREVGLNYGRGGRGGEGLFFLFSSEAVVLEIA